MKTQKYLPYIFAVAVFLIVTLIYFSPLLKGKIINQSDIVQHKGQSQELRDFRKAGKGEALWTNSTFGGMPGYQISPVYSGNWVTTLDKIVHLGLPHPSGYIFMGFLGFFILLLCLGVDPWLSLAGGLAYGFSSYFFIILDVGHNSKSNALGYIAPILGGIILLMRRKYWLGFTLTVFFMALELNANHVQITYYGFLLFALVFATYLVIAIREKSLPAYLKGTGVFALACILGVLPNAASLMATYEYGHYSTRGPTELTIDASMKPNKNNITSGLDKDYAVQYSYGVGETFTFLIPNFKGGITAPIAYANKDALKNVDPELREQVGRETAYFGDQSITAGPVYIGAIVIFLVILGLFILNHPLKWPLLIATIFSVMLSWGKHFMDLTSFFMDHVPGYNKFRAVSMTLVIAELTLPLLAILALDQFIKSKVTLALAPVRLFGKTYDLKKILVISALVAGGFCLLCYLAPTTVNNFTTENEEQEIAGKFRESGASAAQVNDLLPGYMTELTKARENIFQADALRSFLFIAAAFVALILFQTGKIKPRMLIAALAVLFTVDLWPVASRYLNARSYVPKSQYDAPPQKTAADEQILADPALDFRVMNLAFNPFQDATTSFYHKSIGGYHGAKLKKYDELITFHLFKEANLFATGLNEAQGKDSLVLDLTSKLNVLNMLNTRYMILPTQEDWIAFKNPNANGNAWFVKELKTVASADSEIIGLYHTNTKTRALVQQKNKPAGVSEKYDAAGKITLVSYEPNNLVYQTEADNKEFAVFSEIFYPKGWNAYIDGQLKPHTCVDYVLRGMEIPAGIHKVAFKFEPTVYHTGNTISLVGSVLLLLCVAAGIYMINKKKELELA
jgi:hypothetical protein